MTGEANKLLGGWAGRGAGNPRYKSMIECLHSLIHHVVGLLPAASGRDRRVPEATQRILAYDEQVTRWLSYHPEMAEREMLTDDGWQPERLLADSAAYEQVRVARMSPAEVWAAYQPRMTRLPMDAYAMLIDAPNRRRELTTRRGEILVHDRTSSDEPYVYDAEYIDPHGVRRALGHGDKVEVLLNPYDRTHVILLDARAATYQEIVSVVGNAQWGKTTACEEYQRRRYAEGSDAVIIVRCLSMLRNKFEINSLACPAC